MSPRTDPGSNDIPQKLPRDPGSVRDDTDQHVAKFTR